ncbi:MAG TPA: endolytic transglycosylase MltG [Streptosporangiaceae bacterium]|nr:endolytic transglycosylase MltG [Streptosporangiaceae bacterium]
MTGDRRMGPGRGMPRRARSDQREEEWQWPPAGEEAPRYGHTTDPGYAGQEAARGAGPGYPARQGHGYPGEQRPPYGDDPPSGYRNERAGYGPGQHAHGAAYGRDVYQGGSTPGYAGDDPYGYPGDAPYPGTGDQRSRGPRHRGSGAPHPDGARYRDGGPYPYSGQDPYRGQEPYRGEDRYADDASYATGQDNPGRAGDGPPWEDSAYDDERFVPGFGRAAGSAGPAGGSPGRSAPSGRGGKRRRSRWIAPLVAVLVIVLPLAAGGFYAFRFVQGRFFPADYSGNGSGQVVVQVQQGQTATSLGQTLVTLGVVESARAFVLAAEHSTNQAGLQPGFYRLRKHMKASLAYALLLSPASLDQVKITIPEGWRLSQIAADLEKHSGIPAAGFQKALNAPASLGLPSYADGKLEGYLFPATYQVQPKMTATEMLKAMIQRFDQEAASVNLTAAAAAAHLTPGQVITMASLIQAEGGSVSYYPLIARVIYNRLNLGMPLQLDSTVMYGLGTYGIIASNQQLQSTSPYNTYRYKGLPPGPIDSPGDAAIQAVLHPASGNDLYFVTVNPKTGLTKFTASPAQFEQFRAELAQNLGQG